MYELFPETTNVMVSGIFVTTSGEYLRFEALAKYFPYDLLLLILFLMSLICTATFFVRILIKCHYFA